MRLFSHADACSSYIRSGNPYTDTFSTKYERICFNDRDIPSNTPNLYPLPNAEHPA